MPGTQFIQDLAVVLLVAGAAAWICRRLGLSSVVGYLAAGALVGPHTPPFALVADLDQVRLLAQAGLVFLIFSIGLNLNVSRLKRLGASLVLATGIGALLVLNGARVVGWGLGWDSKASLFLAAMLMVSSSAIIAKVIDELNLTHERPAQMALGITVLEDVVAILMLTLLSSWSHWGSGGPGLLSTLGGLGAFLALLAALSLLAVPRLLARLSRDTHREIRTLIVVGLLLGLAWLAVRVGYSSALGAFVFGAIVGSTRHKSEIEKTLVGMQQVFGAVFFVAVGMQVDFRLFAGAWPLVLIVTALGLCLRPLACAAGLVAVGNQGRTALQAGFILVPLGEFSFVIAQLGVDAGVLEPKIYTVAVGASLLTALSAPWFARRSESWAAYGSRRTPALAAHWVDFYHDWLARLRHKQGRSLMWRLTGRRLVQTAVHILAVSALILGAGPVYGWASGAWGKTGWASPAFPFLFWTVFGVVLLGPLIAIWRNLSALAMISAEAATAGARHHRRLQVLLEFALRLVASAVLAVWLVALLPSGWSLLGAAGGVLVVLVVITLVFWRRFVHLHSLLEIELRDQLLQASQNTAASAWSSRIPEPYEDWGLELDEVILPAGSAFAGKRLDELALRPRLGCSVVGIDRQGYPVVNPRAEMVLYPQDRLLLLGTSEQLDRAARELGAIAAGVEGSGGFDDLTLDVVKVPGGSPWIGRTLQELDLIRRFGVQVGGIRRGAQRNLAPSGRDRVEAGDEWLVLGTSAGITELLARAVSPS